MLKTAALALVVLMTGTMGATSALAGGGVRHPPVKIGKIDRYKVNKFLPRKMHMKSANQKLKTLGPDRLPGL